MLKTYGYFNNDRSQLLMAKPLFEKCSIRDKKSFNHINNFNKKNQTQFLCYSVVYHFTFDRTGNSEKEIPVIFQSSQKKI